MLHTTGQWMQTRSLENTSQEETVNRPFQNCLLSELPVNLVEKRVRLIAVHSLHFKLEVGQSSNP